MLPKLPALPPGLRVGVLAVMSPQSPTGPKADRVVDIPGCIPYDIYFQFLLSSTTTLQKKSRSPTAGKHKDSRLTCFDLLLPNFVLFSIECFA